MPAGGRGYTRVPSLISLWSTAPYLLNNTVGQFDPSPSVEARLDSFDDGIEQMLWPEKRDKDPVLGDKVPGIIDRTTARRRSASRSASCRMWSGSCWGRCDAWAGLRPRAGS